MTSTDERTRGGWAERGVCVIGLGYIGLPTSAVLAGHGVPVVGVDVDVDAVEGINSGRVHIVEPDLGYAVAGAVARGALKADVVPSSAGAFIIAVPTPFAEGNKPDLTHVEEAARALAPVLVGGEVVILESTVPPGTTEQVSAWLAEARPDLRFPHEHPDDPDVHVAHCPERVLPGRIMAELVTNERLVGGITRRCAERTASLYEVFCRGEITLTDARSAEMAKLVENSFRDVNIAFANELAGVCEHLGLDVWNVIELANKHPRVSVLNPGPGVGGHCIAVDPWFLVAAAPERTRLIRTAREVNDARPAEVVAHVERLARPGTSVACLGLAFKADVDDLRESPAVEVVRQLAHSRLELDLLAVEPHVDALPKPLVGLERVRLTPLDEALAAADVVVLLVDHAQFAGIDDLGHRGVLDTRGVWRRRQAR